MCYNTQRKCLTTRWHISIFLHNYLSKNIRASDTFLTLPIAMNWVRHYKVSAIFRQAIQQLGVKLETKEWLLVENVERYQSLSKKRLLYKSCCVISIGSRWAELCSFSLTSKGSLSWANILSHFHWANLTLAAPRRRTWQWQMRQCVEEWGGGGRRGEGAGGGSPREGWLPPRGETLTHWPRLVASQRKPPLAQGQPLWVHIFTPGQIAREARKSSPPIPTSLPAHLFLPPPPSKNTLSGAPSAAFWPPVLLFLYFCPQMAVYIYSLCPFLVS